MKTNYLPHFLWISCLVVGIYAVLQGCSGLGETPTSGEFRLVTDETLLPIAEAEVQIFDHTYTNAHTQLSAKPEAQVIADLMNKEAAIALLTRDLNEAEKKKLLERAIYPRITPIAIDALALIVNPQNPINHLSYQQVTDILEGKTTTWQQLGKGNGKINLVFDHAGSSTVRGVTDLIGGKKLPDNAYAMKTNNEVLAYIAKNPNGLGITTLSWLSDNVNDTTKLLYDKISVLSLGAKNAVQDTAYYQPSQEYLLDSLYPLSRPVYLISREAKAGTATGFSAFVASDRGQRIILTAGLVPVVMPTREIIIKKGNLQ